MRQRLRRGSAAVFAAVVLALTAVPVRAGVSDGEALVASRGWRYLVDKLAADGVPRAKAVAAFADPRMPAFDWLGFSLNPRESHARYRDLRSAASIRAARSCHARYADAFRKAEAREGVPASLVASIVHVESACGRTTGSSPVLFRLARLAMANEPANLAWNIERNAGDPPDPALAVQTRERGAYLERTFYPEVRGLFTMQEKLGVDPHDMAGSGAGAFGFPQFLPTSYLRFGVDGNGDGRVSLYDMDDAAASCARFLAGNGWRADLSAAERRRVIWAYNRSDAYVDTILQLHRQIDATQMASADGDDGKPAPRAAKPKARSRTQR